MEQFEKDLTELFKNRMINDKEFCKDIWAALSNVEWRNKETNETYSCSFRYAGGLISDIIGEGNYLDWYCSGEPGTVTEEIEEALASRGWEHESLWL